MGEEFELGPALGELKISMRMKGDDAPQAIAVIDEHGIANFLDGQDGREINRLELGDAISLWVIFKMHMHSVFGQGPKVARFMCQQGLMIIWGWLDALELEASVKGSSEFRELKNSISDMLILLEN